MTNFKQTTSTFYASNMCLKHLEKKNGEAAIGGVL